eukprot:3296443-Prymnesium_polylepis.1
MGLSHRAPVPLARLPRRRLPRAQAQAPPRPPHPAVRRAAAALARRAHPPARARGRWLRSQRRRGGGCAGAQRPRCGGGRVSRVRMGLPRRPGSHATRGAANASPELRWARRARCGHAKGDITYRARRTALEAPFMF